MLQQRFYQCDEGFGLFAATGEELISRELDFYEEEEEVTAAIGPLIQKYKALGFQLDP